MQNLRRDRSRADSKPPSPGAPGGRSRRFGQGVGRCALVAHRLPAADALAPALPRARARPRRAVRWAPSGRSSRRTTAATTATRPKSVLQTAVATGSAGVRSVSVADGEREAEERPRGSAGRRRRRRSSRRRAHPSARCTTGRASETATQTLPPSASSSPLRSRLTAGFKTASPVDFQLDAQADLHARGLEGVAAAASRSSSARRHPEQA